MSQYVIDKIPLGNYFSKTAYLDENFVLLSPEIPFDQEMALMLKEWRFSEVICGGELEENYATDKADTIDAEIIKAAGIGDGEKLKRAESFYDDFLKYMNSLLLDVSGDQELSFNKIAKKIKDACEIIREDRRFIMRVMQSFEPSADENYLTSHSVRSTILAIIIGLNLKLPFHRLIELGVATLLHEIGMKKLPQKIYLSNKQLDPQEQKQIMAHPIISYNVLKNFGFPLAVSVAALEHHERENGMGYPRRLSGNKISLYAKIIAVACSYEALSASRPHKEPKDGYTGMLELLKNEGKKYDDTIVRALVYSLSIYPIGLYVLLSDGKKAQVIDVIPEKPRFPIVHLLNEFTPDGRNKVVETSADDVFIERPLAKQEIGS